MKFIADVMLGRLARWLRLLGFDVLYFRNAEDRELVRIARAEGRTLLTRDTRLAVRKGLEAPILIASDDIRQQLRQLGGSLDFSASLPQGRCDRCNGILEEVVHREAVRDLVPEHVYMTSPAFARCTSCGKVYWPGSHYRAFHREVEGILRRTREE